MKNLKTMTKFISFVAITVAATLSIPASADETNELTELWQIANGGKIYDNWASTLMTSLPSKTHPSYPAAGKKKGGDTWRCKECHGWDYKGKDGAYASGSHYTGIIGVRSMIGKPAADIKKIIRNKTHGYTKSMIPEIALENLVTFLSRGQIEMAQYIDYGTKAALGDPDNGARFYQSICAICHGFDGKSINFKPTSSEPEYIGTVASANPWETLHKIRNGQPGVPMVALSVLDIQDQLDILSYAQTLPTK